MREDWEYKIFTDCIEKVKYTEKIQSSDYKTQGKYPIISQEEDDVSGYWDDDKSVFKISKPIVVFGDHTRIIKYVDFDFVLGADGVKILQPINELNAKFFSYFLKSYPIPSLGYSRHFKVLKEISVPVPPLPTQQSIVSELDSLSKIIADCKETLKDYDALEQSIFYDMFGDPVKNDKGWDVKKLGEIGNVQRGSGLSKKDLVEEGYPCILYGQIHTKFGAYIKKHIACIPKDLVCTAKIAHYGDLVMAITSEDVEGSCKSTAWMGDYDIAVGSDAAIFRHNQNGIYVSYYTRTNAFYHEKAKYARGFKVTHISTKEIETIPILLPPLPLQQQFASKIEAIEQMKSETKKALQETETLFQARMDYWFN